MSRGRDKEPKKDASKSTTAPPSARGAAQRVTLTPTLQHLDGLEVDTLVLLIADDERPMQGAAGLLDWRMCGWLSEQLRHNVVTGRRGERVLTHPNLRVPLERVVVLGGGPAKDLVSQLRALLAEASEVVVKAMCEKVALAGACSAAALIEALSSAPADLQDRVRVVFDNG